MTGTHIAILVDNEVNTQKLVKDLRIGLYPDFHWLTTRSIGEFSMAMVEHHIEEEERHGQKILAKEYGQSLKSMSSGERKKALLNHLIKDDPDIYIVIDPLDSLDRVAQQNLRDVFEKLSRRSSIVQITNRISDILPFMERFYLFQGNQPQSFKSLENLKATLRPKKEPMGKNVPQPLKHITTDQEDLVAFNKVSIAFKGRSVLNKITWKIKKGEFWQLTGQNGTGKSTLLHLMTGDSHKGYGQDLTLFGHKKGSGESVWDLKGNIGYFSPSMVDRFKGRHTLEHMIISGLHDSVGLYVKPSETEKHKALEWLRFLGLEHKKHHYFHELGIGGKRRVMTARAMIKHPPLLILDEPTVGLDDTSTTLFVKLVNDYAKESSSAIIYVSHRKEPRLHPKQIFKLQPSDQGSNGFIESV